MKNEGDISIVTSTVSVEAGLGVLGGPGIGPGLAPRSTAVSEPKFWLPTPMMSEIVKLTALAVVVVWASAIAASPAAKLRLASDLLIAVDAPSFLKTRLDCPVNPYRH